MLLIKNLKPCEMTSILVVFQLCSALFFTTLTCSFFFLKYLRIGCFFTTPLLAKKTFQIVTEQRKTKSDSKKTKQNKKQPNHVEKKTPGNAVCFLALALLKWTVL